MDSRWLKIRLLEESVPFYNSLTEESPSAYLTERPVLEIKMNKTRDTRVPIILSDGLHGFIPSTAERRAIPLLTTVFGANVYSEPNRRSSVVATVDAGSLIQQFDLPFKSEDESWNLVRLKGRKMRVSGIGCRS